MMCEVVQAISAHLLFFKIFLIVIDGDGGGRFESNITAVFMSSLLLWCHSCGDLTFVVMSVASINNVRQGICGQPSFVLEHKGRTGRRTHVQLFNPQS